MRLPTDTRSGIDSEARLCFNGGMSTSNTNTDRAAAQAARITTLWLDAYGLWERGESCSPSATDLASAASTVIPIPIDELSSLAEAIFEDLSEGMELADIAAWIVDDWHEAMEHAGRFGL